MFVADGLLIVSVEGASLMLPPRRIGWIPPGTVHPGASYGTTIGGMPICIGAFVLGFLNTPTILKLTSPMEALVARICDVGFDRTE